MITRRLTSLLLLSTALTVPTLAHGADQPASPPDAAASAASAASPASASQEDPEVSIPGVSEVVVTGTRANTVRSTSQVVSILSTQELQRSGEGNIAGALNRLSGISLVGGGYVYVRGLGDRYSLALLNGSPLPSPEPLKRVVPLDLFPSSIISSALVQKTYSPNFPGEFGGGVINLTTRSIPQDGFFTFGASVSGDTETTNQLGYTYYGSKTDWTGYDNGNRDTPSALAAFLASGERISSGKVDTAKIASQLVTGRNAVLQKDNNLPVNVSLNAAGAKSFDLGSGNLGVIGAAGYSNRWQTRDATNQTSLNGDLEDLESDFTRVTTQNRLIVNGLIGLAYEFGETNQNKIRWTNLYIHDTIKHSRLGLGNRKGTTVDYMQQDTAWYERQLLDTQFVGEFKPTENLSLDVRASYAKTKRDAPYELSFEYVRTNAAADPYGKYFVNRLNNGNNGDAKISFSQLDERLWSGGADVSYRFSPDLSVTAGYAYADTRRTSSRRDFQFQAPNTFPGGVDMFRPDLLLQPSVINAFGITMVESNEGSPAFLATLKNHAAYAKVNGRIAETVKFDVGVRYETAEENVAPITVFNTPGASTAATNLDNDYWLPAATLTWEVRPDMQLRANLSKTLARPQFRELIFQFYFDPDTNRQYRGNPLMVDSELTNAEVRYEWYFATDQRLSAAGFYKRLKNPIESYVSGESFITSFANAPKADLYGIELDAQKYFEVSDWLKGDLWATRRVLLSGNYTYSKSELLVSANDTVAVFNSSSTLATDFFRDGAPLTGQSEHVANFQIGLEDSDHLSQQTLMINYASKRVTSRGLANSGQPDIFEHPGFRLDLVLRQGVEVAGRDIELKFEARNLTGRKYEEYQQTAGNRVDVNTYKVGRVFTLSASTTF
ncbi:MAG: TonB-dependent receptor [Alphaproteobacteria bacterium]|nr:TonB-dependent receptor [Alphaproteobacteria bacterium]MBU1516825.1 TonB-dependent receptor [Alphaproteobacteria bacterium]MBU2092519.1 TonB-dependent receptor [Alphaproteobacteria bacterium]MBU2151369.1 TonB-dependent receptor [Alphaproteobacteria bacterium]MBU2309672.1 TonB-dependent receptor [Alphaproteobacteria bacterium]